MGLQPLPATYQISYNTATLALKVRDKIWRRPKRQLLIVKLYAVSKRNQSQNRDDSSSDGVSKFQREQLWFNLDEENQKNNIRNQSSKKQRDQHISGQLSQGHNQISDKQYWEQWTEKKIQEVLDLEYEVDASHRVEQLLQIVDEEGYTDAEVVDVNLDQEQYAQQIQDDASIIQYQQGFSSQPIEQQDVQQKQSAKPKRKKKILKQSTQDGNLQLQQLNLSYQSETSNQQEPAKQKKISKVKVKKQKQSQQDVDTRLVYSTVVKSSSSELERSARRKRRREGTSVSQETIASVGAYVGIEAGAVVKHAFRQLRYQSSQATQLASLPFPPLNSKRYTSKKSDGPNPKTSTYLLLKYSGQQPKLSQDQKVELAALAQQGIKIARTRQDLESDLQREATVMDIAVALGWSMDIVRERTLNGRRAREVLIRSHLKMVVKIANKYQPKVDMTLEDLIAEGLIGLNVGIEKHDIKRGSSITTTLYIYARQAMWLAITSEQSVVCIPKSSLEQMVKVKKVLEKQPNLSNNQIAKLTKLKEANVERARSNMEISQKMMSQMVTYKDKQRQADITETLESKVDRTSSEQEWKQQQDQETEICINQMLEVLEDSERDILCRYYGLGSQVQQPMSQMKLAKELKISRSEVQKILNASLLKLRDLGEMEGLANFVTS